MTDMQIKEDPDAPVGAWDKFSADYISSNPAAESMETSEHESARQRTWRRFRKNRSGMLASVVILVIILIAIFAPFISPHDPNSQDLSNVLGPPSGSNPFGTDDLGRDVLSRLFDGAHVSLLAAAQATLIAVIIGVPFGLIAGYAGGRTDRAISFVNDAVMSLPGLLLAIAIVGMLGPGLRNAMIAVGIVFAPRVLRIVRGSVSNLKHDTFVEASRSIGTPTFRIISWHVLRNVRSPLIVEISLLAARALLAEASLSFLGLGAQYPAASWGAMVGRAFPYVGSAPSLIIIPGIAIAILVLAFNVCGDALRDSLGREDRSE